MEEFTVGTSSEAGLRLSKRSFLSERQRVILLFVTVSVFLFAVAQPTTLIATTTSSAVAARGRTGLAPGV